MQFPNNARRQSSRKEPLLYTPPQAALLSSKRNTPADLQICNRSILIIICRIHSISRSSRAGKAGMPYVIIEDIPDNLNLSCNRIYLIYTSTRTADLSY